MASDFTEVSEYLSSLENLYKKGKSKGLGVLTYFDNNSQLDSPDLSRRDNLFKEQLKKAGCEERLQFPFHQGIIDGTLPLTIGGGIGQSRVCMFMLEKAHVGEVQVSVWPEDMIRECEEHGITLLQ